MIKIMKIMWDDKRARIPFAALGIFLLIGSATISIVMTGLENEHAKNVSVTMKSGEIEKMLASLKNDLAICLNYAGLDAMNYAGKHPVTKPNTKSKVATDYNGDSWDNYNDKDGWSIDEMMQFNINWIRNMTRNKMNLYIEENYIDDTFNNGRYAINVDYIEKWRDIKVKKIYMDLNTPISNSIRNLFSDGKNKYEVYWIFYIPLKIEIKDLENGQIVSKRLINISSLISSRLPLLMELTQNFEKSINDTNLLNNKLFLIFTLLSEIYTEGRALFQYGGQYEKFPNIVDNRWLRYLLNGAILFEEFMFFGSIDPVTAISLLLNWKDLTATGFPEENMEDVRAEFNSAATEFSKIFGKPDENMIKTISNNSTQQREAKEKIDGAETQINLTNIARSLLFDVKYNYYYYTENGELYKENGELPHSFKGYEIYTYYNETYYKKYNRNLVEYEYHGENWSYNGYVFHIKRDKTYTLIHPPPYVYYNETFYNNTHSNKTENTYHGKKWWHDGYLFHLIPSSDKFCKEEIGNNLNKTLIQQIENEIKGSYTAIFKIKVDREEVESPHYEPFKSSYWDCRKGGDNEWHLCNATNLSSVVSKGDAITEFPYQEEWLLEWHQNHIYGHRTPIYDENGSFIGYSCEEKKEFTYVKKEKVRIIIYATYPNVIDAFNPTEVMLGQMKHDENLFQTSKNFSTKFIDIRKNIFNNTWKNKPIEENWSGMDWLRGINGEVATALKEIFNEMKKIKANVKDIKNKSANQIIDESINQLLQKIEQNKTRYLKEDFYKNGSKYKSCGARVVARMREWYVNRIEEILREAIENAKKKIDENIDNELKKHGVKMDELNKAKDKLEGVDADNLPAIQFGLTLSLINSSLNWDEKIGFSIDQVPNYFKPSKSTDTYTFLEKNICLFGPTGLPILPTPVTPWVITINAWYIEIQGSFSKFKVVDAVGEMNPNMLFGETDQAYVRECNQRGFELSITDPYNNQVIGWNLPISFTIKTGNIAIVPPSFVGDINPTSYPIEYDGPGG